MENSCFFSVRSLTQTQLIDGFKIVVTTNTPIHLYMRWTTVKPQYHTIPVYRRGLLMHGDRYVCFVAYKENEQEEVGDTLIHTFIKTAWPDCQTRWFYFWGKVGAMVCRSTSAVFEKHFASPGTYDALPCWHNRYFSASWSDWPDTRQGRNQSNYQYYQRPSSYLIVNASMPFNFWIYRAYMNFHTVDVPTGKIIITAQLGLFITEKVPELGVIFITKGHWDEPVTEEDWDKQTDELVDLGHFFISEITLDQYNWADFTPAGLDWLNESALKDKQWESYDWWPTYRESIYGLRRWSQNFTPVSSHKLRTLNLQLQRIGDAGMFYVNIFETTPDGCPTGDSLAFAYDYAIMLSDAPWGAWRRFILNQPVWVEAGKTYAIVLRVVDGDVDNRILWIAGHSTYYPNGFACYSDDGGITWTSGVNRALFFIEYECESWDKSQGRCGTRVGGTNLCLRADLDITNTEPEFREEHSIKFYSAQKGGVYNPILRIYLGKP